MRAGGMQPGPGGYGVVMAACHRAGQGERVLALLEVRVCPYDVDYGYVQICVAEPCTQTKTDG